MTCMNCSGVGSWEPCADCRERTRDVDRIVDEALAESTEIRADNVDLSAIDPARTEIRLQQVEEAIIHIYAGLKVLSGNMYPLTAPAILAIEHRTRQRKTTRIVPRG